jgi:hypothetical protein
MQSPAVRIQDAKVELPLCAPGPASAGLVECSGEGMAANQVTSRRWPGDHARVDIALFLFTDVGPDDAPTRLMCGSHLTVARFLAPYGETGTDADTQLWYPSTLCRLSRTRRGRPGTCSCATPSSCTRRPDRTGVPGPG